MKTYNPTSRFQLYEHTPDPAALVPSWWFRLSAWWNRINAKAMRSHRQIAEWNVHVAERALLAAQQEVDARRRELRQTDAAIRVYDEQERDSSVRLGMRAAR